MATLCDSLTEIWNELSAGLPEASYSTSYIIVAVTSLCVIASVLTYSKVSVKGQLPLPPGSLGFPLIGETVQFLYASYSALRYRAYFKKKVQKYGSVFKIHVLGSPLVVMDPPTGNKFLFQNDGKTVKLCWPASMVRLLGHEAMTLKSGEEYKVLRRHLDSFLDHTAVRRYLDGVSSIAVEHFSRHWKGKDELLAMDATRTFTFSLMCNLLITLDEGPVLDELQVNFDVWTSGLMSLPVNLPGFAYNKALKARKLIDKTLDTIMTLRKQELAEGRVSERAKIDVLTSFLTVPVENGSPLSESAVKDNLVLLLFAGFDTSSASLGMTIFLIGKNPDVYKQLVQEHKAIMERKRRKGESDALTTEDLAAMKYTWRLLQEALRLYPPVVGSFRKALTDIEYNGYTIPKGWNLMWTNQISHYDQAFFADPLTFNPSRWEERAAPHTFLPFGGGPHTCPGYEFAKSEMLVFIHHLVRRYEWSLEDPDEPVIRDPMPRTPKNIPIKITKISSL